MMAADLYIAHSGFQLVYNVINHQFELFAESSNDSVIAAYLLWYNTSL